MQKSVKDIIIAVDGHSSCGKSTVAKQLGRHLGLKYIDTGAMYRAVTLFALQHGMVSDAGVKEAPLEEALSSIQIELRELDNGLVGTFLNGENVEEAIRSLGVSRFVSLISTLGFVRRFLVHQQQEMGRKGGYILDGRDIGTTVFPDADFKLFMTASPQIRAQRRFDEMKQKGLDVTYEAILKNVEERDRIDSERKESPLRKADDALVLDNSSMTHQEQFNWILQRLSERGYY